MTADIFKHLDTLGIPYTRVDHPPVYTCEQAQALVPELPGSATKNLVLRDAKGKRHFLLVVPDRKSVDLKQLGAQLDSGRLGMGSPERLRRLLGIDPGAVSVLALINDPEAAVELLVDREVWEQEALHCHPLVNTATLVIDHAGIERFISSTGHTPRIIDVPERNLGNEQ